MSLAIIYAEIDLKAIAHNTRTLKEIASPKTRLMAVVKANGYGHGAVQVAKTALESGADALGVARIHEALDLRQAGCGAPILIFGYTPPCLTEQLIEFDLTQTVFHPGTVREYAAAASRQGKRVKVHLKIDTGMGRLGFIPDFSIPCTRNPEAPGTFVAMVRDIIKQSSLEVEGIFTHFSTADCPDKAYTREQLDKFLACLEMLRAAGLTFSIRHAANSAALIDLPETHLDMVRPGIAVYGLNPFAYGEHNAHQCRIKLKPAMSFKSQIIHLKEVPAGFNISYGNTYQTHTATTIATIPVGYADGLNRLLSSRGNLLVHGVRAPIVGRICMDHTMADVGHIHDVAIGDEVVIIGSQENETVSADEMASVLDTISYEVVSSIMPRVPRVYP